MSKANELAFQNDMINQLLENGWLLGKPEHNLNPETLSRYVKSRLRAVSESIVAQLN